jgi:hypothetical protein
MPTKLVKDMCSRENVVVFLSTRICGIQLQTPRGFRDFVPVPPVVFTESRVSSLVGKNL